MLNWTNDHREWYNKVYLQSQHWIDLRKEKLFVNPLCEKCNSTYNLQVHHIRYKNIFDVNLSDLQTLCDKCHKNEHTVNGYPKRSKRDLFKSQKELPEYARNKIVNQLSIKIERINQSIKRYTDKNKTPLPSLIKALNKYSKQLKNI